MSQENIDDLGTGTTAQGIILALMSTLAVAASLLIAPVLPKIIAGFPNDPNAEQKVILALTIPSLVIVFVAPFCGKLAESIGRKPVLLAALVIYLICGVAPFFLNDLTQIIISRLGVGVAEAALMTASTALIGDFFKGSRREFWVVVQTSIASVASVVFALVSGILGDISWRVPFIVYAMPIIYIPLILFMINEPKHEEIVKSSAPFPWKKVMPLYAIGFPATILFFIIPIQTPFLLTERGMGAPQLFGLLGAISGVFVAVGGAVFKKLSHLKPFQLLAIAFAINAIGLLFFIGNGSLLMTGFGLVLSSIGCGMILPTLLSNIMGSLSFDQRGRGAGGWQTAFFLGNFISPILIMVLSKGIGGLSNALMIMFALSAILAVFSYFVTKNKISN